MIFYADTSFLTSLYLLDANNVAAEQLMQRLDPQLPLTGFGTFELRNALRCAVFRKMITANDAEVALRRVKSASTSGSLTLTSCAWEDVLRSAESLSDLHTHLIGCRALDILHVAIAVVLGCTGFLTFDQRQARLAQQAALTTHS